MIKLNNAIIDLHLANNNQLPSIIYLILFGNYMVFWEFVKAY